MQACWHMGYTTARGYLSAAQVTSGGHLAVHHFFPNGFHVLVSRLCKHAFVVSEATIGQLYMPPRQSLKLGCAILVFLVWQHTRVRKFDFVLLGKPFHVGERPRGGHLIRSWRRNLLTWYCTQMADGRWQIATCSNCTHGRVVI